MSEERLLTEAALLATRSDVEEELVRLRTHVERFVEMLDAGGEVGRRLDFLLQEMNREANTMLSKTGRAGEQRAATDGDWAGDEGGDGAGAGAGAESGVEAESLRYRERSADSIASRSADLLADRGSVVLKAVH